MKAPVQLLIVWVTQAIVAALIFLIGLKIILPWFITYGLSVSILVIDLIWILLTFYKKGKETGFEKELKINLQQTIKQNTEKAVKKYYEKTHTHSIVKKNTLYSRPWLLICGMMDSGKRSLLVGSGLDFQFTYPSQIDDVSIDKNRNDLWHFANQSVWIETPDSMIEECGGESWRFFAESIRNVRPVRPIDGLALVIDIKKILNGEDQEIVTIASLFRNRICELIDILDIEFPFYLIFNHIDEVQGFREYFGEQLQNDPDMVFGVTIAEEIICGMEISLFNVKFNALCNVLADLRLDKLHKENDSSNKKMICRFVIRFEEMKTNLEIFISELFKQSDYSGSTIFKGFYFTCAEKIKSNEEAGKLDQTSNTIINHPLNPYSLMNRPQKISIKKESQTKVPKALFVTSLLKEIIVNNGNLVRTTRKKERKDAISKLLIVACIIIAGIIIVVSYIKSETTAAIFIDDTCNYLKSINKRKLSLEENYNVIDKLKDKIEKIQENSKRYPILIGFSFYREHEVLNELKKEYFQRIKRFIVIPASKYLEYKILKLSSSDETSGKEYKKLYSSLKVYLIMSGAVPENTNSFDTTMLNALLLDAVENSISATTNNPDVPDVLVNILQRNIKLYLYFLSTEEFNKISANKNIIGRARNCLRKIPGPEVLYECVISEISKDIPTISLENIMNVKDEEDLFQSGNEISIAYTQEGWERYVQKTLEKTAKDPFRTDWVIGKFEEENNKLIPDNKKLYEELVEEYFKDLKDRWLTFISSIKIENPKKLSKCPVLVKKLQCGNSEFSNIFESIEKTADVKDKEGAGKNKNKIGNIFGKSKAGLSKNINNLTGGMQFQNSNNSPFERNSGFFKYLSVFGNSQENQEYALYKKKLTSLSEKLVEIDGQIERYSEVFNGSDDDPLAEGYKWIKNAPFSIPDLLQSAVLKLLIQPFEITGELVSEPIGTALNDKWDQEVYKMYSSEISGKYPFADSKEDASLQDVINFFRPKTGVFWGFYERALSNYLIIENGTAMEKLNGAIKIRFNPELFTSMTTSEKVSGILFRPDGKTKNYNIRIQPNFSSKFKAHLEIAGQTISLSSVDVVNTSWPCEGKEVILSLEALNGLSHDITFDGEWGLFKLLNSAKLNITNNGKLAARWQFNIQSTYMANIDADIHISEPDNPFTEFIVFKKISCPQKIVITN